MNQNIVRQPPTQSIYTLRAARDTARKVRAEWLVAVAEGLVSVDDVIREAGTQVGHPLLVVSLRQLLLAQPLVGEARTETVLTKMTERLESANSIAPTSRHWTVSSLLDKRVGGRRYIAFQDARMSRVTPSSGFPFSPLARVIGVTGEHADIQGGTGR